MSRTFDEFLKNNGYNVPLSRPIAVSSVVGFGLVEEFHYDGTDRSFPRFLHFYFVFSCFLTNPTNRIIRRINDKWSQNLTAKRPGWLRNSKKLKREKVVKKLIDLFITNFEVI